MPIRVPTSLDAENRARVSMTATGRFTDNLPSDLIFRYWRDIHGVLDARLPGMHSYRQYHCDPADTTGDTLFDRVERVEFDWVPEHKLSSCAHILFLEPEDVDRCRNSELFPLVEDDNLAISARKRSSLAPDVPTAAEAGYPDFKLESNFVLLAPAGVPDAVADLLEREVRAALKSPDLHDKFRAQDITVIGSDAAAARALILDRLGQS